jgi:L-rhamnose isomerase
MLKTKLQSTPTNIRYIITWIIHEKVLSHYTVNHSKKEYANGDIHVNSDEI